MAVFRIFLVLLLTVCSVSAATREPVHARRAMAVTAERHATQAAYDVLRNGGNAVDAAIAAGFALAVTHPAAGNIGGGGFMLIRLADGQTTFIDFRERAPRAAHRGMYLGPGGLPTDESVVGYRASGVPGTVRGLELALKNYGSQKWAELIRPAVSLARNGFPVSHKLAEALRNSGRLAKFPESKRIFLNEGRFLERGDLLRQPELARTLERIAARGADEFYRGKTARLIAAGMKRNGGLITGNDLAEYRPVERKPLRGTYEDLEIWSAPPPSSGGAGVIQMLQMLEDSGYERGGVGAASTIHYVAEVMRRFFADRAEYFGDADFVDVPLQRLLSRPYALARRRSIDPQRATPSSEVRPGDLPGAESENTTHYSIVDETGNAVAVTYTLNSSFGSGVTIRGAGVLMNNEMDDFTAKPGEPNQFGLIQSERNAIEPGKRPLSAMTPTIVTRGGKLFLVLGSPGGPTIINTVLQVIVNVADFGMNLQQAVDFPRFHHQWTPDELRMEDHGFSPDTIELLRERGHEIRLGGPMGRVMAVEVRSGELLGAADSRSEGLALGY